MRITSLELSNIRSYRKQKILFPAGSILFRGDMGSGKSTILMAIEFALFGSSSLIQQLLTKKEQHGEVVLKFDINGTQCEIGRSLSVKNNKVVQSSKESYIVIDGTKEPLSVSDLKSRVLQILGFNEPTNPRAESRVYRYVVYTPQEEIKSIVYGKDREEIIRRAFGMEDYKTSINNIQVIVREMKNTRDNIAVRFEKLDQYITQLHDKESSMSKLNNELKECTVIESDLDAQKKSNQSNLENITLQLREITRLKEAKAQLQTSINNDEKSRLSHQNNISQLKSKLSGINDTISQYEDMTSPTETTLSDVNYSIKQASDQETQRHTLIAQRKNLQKSIDNINDKLKGLTMPEILARIDDTKIKINSDNDTLSEIENRYRESGENKSVLEHQAHTITKKIKDASTLGSRCEVCDSELDPINVQKLQEDRKSELNKINDKIDATQNNILQLKSQIHDTKQQIQNDKELLENYNEMYRYAKDKEDAENELQTISKDVSDINPDDFLVHDFDIRPGEKILDYLYRLKDAIVTYDNTMKIFNEKRQTKYALEQNLLNAQQSHDDIKSQMATKQTQLDEINIKLSDSDTIQEQYDNVKRRQSKIEQEINAHKEKISGVRTSMKFVKDDIESLKSDIDIAKKHKARHDTYQDSIDWLEEYYIKSVLAIDVATRNSLRYDFEQFYKKWYDILIDDPTKTSSIDEKFGPILYQDGYDISVDSLSGGEKTSVALAYRLALNSTIRRQLNILQSNLLILDEPTDGFSRHQMEKVRVIFDSLRCDQIIMVSHETELEGYVDNVFRVTKNEGVSSIQKM